MRRVPVLRLICWLMLFIPSPFLAGGTTAEMIHSWKEQTAHGDAYAPFNLGHSYQEGQGVERNLGEAAKWYRLGAERGDLLAALNLAHMYLTGEGVQKNEGEAIEWYVKVGKSDTWFAPSARANLLVLARNYSLGDQGVKPDQTKARALFKRLLEIEVALAERGKSQMDQSVWKANRAADNILKIIKDK